MKRNRIFYLNIFLALFVLIGAVSCDKSDSAIAPSAGAGGSLARFTIVGIYLYVVDHQNLTTFSITAPTAPVSTNSVQVGFDVETIFAWKDKLFIGSQSAMFIYSIADPASPRYLGEASHVRACDPVVANNSIAYVTVRSAGSCGGTVNSLFVYDYQDALNPVLKKEIPMNNPQGLGLQGSTLFVCDNSNGLAVFSLANSYSDPYLVATVKGETFYDCIPDGNILICMVEGGTVLYDISDPGNIKQLGKITN